MPVQVHEYNTMLDKSVSSYEASQVNRRTTSE
jgi:hypothetical protein